MSARVHEHVPAEELVRMAVSPRPDSAEFDRIRAHVALPCDKCARAFDECKSVMQDPFLPPLVRDRWIVPRRIARSADIRQGVLADHQLVCGAGNYELDVIVRELEAPQRLDIGGQVTRAAALHDPARDVPLYLLEARGNDLVSATRTDEFGEFDFSATSGNHYGLRVGDNVDAPCVLVWDGAM